MMDKRTLSELVQRASGGDKQAFEQIYEEKARSVLFRVKQIIGDRDEAEDVAQEVMMAVYRQIGNLRNPDHFNAWLHSVVMNKSNDQLRKKYIKKKRVMMIEDLEDLESEGRTEFLPREFAENEEKKQALMEEIEKLPAKRKMALMLFYFEGLNTAEIAGLTGTTVGNVTSSISKAKVALVKNLSRRFGTIEAEETAVGAMVLGVALDGYLKDMYPQSYVKEMIKSLHIRLTAPGSTVAVPKIINKRIRPATIRSVAMGTVAVVGIAVCGLVANLKNAPGEAVIPYPGFSPAEQTLVAPQPSDTTLPAGGKSEVQADSEWHVQGTLIYLNHSGEELTDTGLPLNGFVLRLRTPAGELVATIITEEDGVFDFGQLGLNSHGYYLLDVSTPQDDELLATATITSTRVGYDADAAAGEIQMKVGISIRRTPEFTLELQDGSCACGHVNPGRVVLREQRVRLQSVRWTILDASGAEYRTIQDVPDDTISVDSLDQTLARMLNAGTDGLYTICIEATDVFGNTTEKRIDIVIDSGIIAPNQYS